MACWSNDSPIHRYSAQIFVDGVPLPLTPLLFAAVRITEPPVLPPVEYPVVEDEVLKMIEELMPPPPPQGATRRFKQKKSPAVRVLAAHPLVHSSPLQLSLPLGVPPSHPALCLPPRVSLAF